MRGLLMIEQLYHQAVAGRKTQTRRAGGLEAVNESPDEWYIAGSEYVMLSPEEAAVELKNVLMGKPTRSLKAKVYFNHKSKGILQESVECKPRYQVGETLFLKEPYWLPTPTSVHHCGPTYMFDVAPVARKGVQWKNKMFMPERFARQYVRITGVDCERLLDINAYDAAQEGIEWIDNPNERNGSWYKNYQFNPKKDGINTNGFHSARISFFSLFAFANKIKVTQLPNPWVWKYSFELVK